MAKKDNLRSCLRGLSFSLSSFRRITKRTAGEYKELDFLLFRCYILFRK